MTFGVKSDLNSCDVHTLMENISPCSKMATKNHHICTNIDKFRHYLYNSVNFHMFDLRTLLYNQYNVDENGCVSFEDITAAMRQLRLRYNENHLKDAIIYFRLIGDGDRPEVTGQQRINVDQFLQLIHLHNPLPHPVNTVTLPANFDNKYTTYRLLCEDRDKPLPPERPQKTTIFNDDDLTRAGDCISPDIPMNYGLAPSDFEQPRSKEQLQIIFKRLLSDNFEEIWSLACKNQNNDVPASDCLISVNQLRKAMNEHNMKILTQFSPF